MTNKKQVVLICFKKYWWQSCSLLHEHEKVICRKIKILFSCLETQNKENEYWAIFQIFLSNRFLYFYACIFDFSRSIFLSCVANIFCLMYMIWIDTILYIFWLLYFNKFFLYTTRKFRPKYEIGIYLPTCQINSSFLDTLCFIWNLLLSAKMIESWNKSQFFYNLSIGIIVKFRRVWFICIYDVMWKIEKSFCCLQLIW